MSLQRDIRDILNRVIDWANARIKVDVQGTVKIDQTTPGTTNKVVAELSGRKATIINSDYNQSLNVVANGNTVITITPPVGELWHIKGLFLDIAKPNLATSGTHYINVRTGSNASKGDKFYGQNLYNASITCRFNNFYASNQTIPTTPSDIQRAILNLMVSNNNPLFVNYTNSTDVAQTNTLNISIEREVEYIVS